MSSLLLQNGYVVDPYNNVEGFRDVLIRNGRIEKIGGAITDANVAEVMDLQGRTLLPGIIDAHAHTGSAGDMAFRMLALAGVTTVIDFAGDTVKTAAHIARNGCGINAGFLYRLAPGDTISHADCSIHEIRQSVDHGLDKGALGVKILGGHYPLTPEATAKIIAYANTRKAYVAYHAGTTQSKNVFHAFQEAFDLADGNRLHLAHVNSYCRGLSAKPIDEMSAALSLLEQNRNIRSESYLSHFNGTPGQCEQGVPVSQVTRYVLVKGGYAATQAGLEEAILSDYAHVSQLQAGVYRLAKGQIGLAYFKEMKTDVMLSFSVNDALNAIGFAMHRNRDGLFTVDAISSDGGIIPRNVIVELGMPLTRYNDFTIQDFVRKTAVNPARLFGLQQKGHLGEGADADITVVDRHQCKPFMTVVNGSIVMLDGLVIGKGGTLITTSQGVKHIQAMTAAYRVADIEGSALYA